MRHLLNRPTAHWLGIILATFVALTCGHNIALPLFEGNDEGPHYQYVDYLATQRRTPDLNRPFAVSHEVNQPPLYYALGALLIAPIDRRDFAEIYRVLPDFTGGIINDHVLAREREFPPRGAVLAMRLLRLFSTLLGAGVLICIFATAKLVFARDDLALLATALMAFNPKFLHMSAQVNNDIALGFTSALVLWQCARLVGQAGPITLRQALALGGSIGLATLCKYGGLALWGPAVLALGWNVGATVVGATATLAVARARAWATASVAPTVAFAVVAGPLLVYNVVQYGHPLAWAQVQLANAGLRRAVPLSSELIVAYLPSVLTSVWDFFGYGIHFGETVNQIMLGVMGLAAIGLIVAAYRRQLPRTSVLLAVAGLTALVAFISWMRVYDETRNARLLVAAFPTLAIFVAAGLLGWMPHRWRNALVALCSVSAGLASLAALLGFLIPAYATPPELPTSELASINTAPVHFDNGIQLLQAALEPTHLNNTDSTHVMILWRASHPITITYRLVIEAFDEHGQSLSRQDTLPFNGRFATPRWQPNATYRDEYTLPITNSNSTRSVATIFVGWYEYRPPYRLVHVADNGAVSVPIGQIKVRGTAPSPNKQPERPFAATFGDGIALEGFDLHDGQITLYWRSHGTPAKNYTVFVHALDAHGKPMGQSDAAIDYPTALWDAGEQIIDTHLPTGLSDAASIQVGLYDAATGARLSANHPDGTPWPDNAVQIK